MQKKKRKFMHCIFNHILSPPPPSSSSDQLGYFIPSFRPFSSPSLMHQHWSYRHVSPCSALRRMLGFRTQILMRSWQTLDQLSLVPALLVQSSINSSPFSLFTVQFPVPRSRLLNFLHQSFEVELHNCTMIGCGFL